MRQRVLALMLAAVSISCGGRPGSLTNATPQETRCRPLTNASREAIQGSLRRALSELESPSPPFCDTDQAALLHARILLELGRPEDAGRRAAGVRGHEAEVRSLQSEMAERIRPRTEDEIRRSAELFRSASAFGEPRAEEMFLEAWKLDPPNGLALIKAGQRAQAKRALRLFERGVAELERETGVPSHVGIAHPPLCGGLHSNYLTVQWLADGIHAVITCHDGRVVAELRSNWAERVAALDDDLGVDPARLPRLRFVPLEKTRTPDVQDFEGRRVRLSSGGFSPPLRLAENESISGVTASSDRRFAFATIGAEDANGDRKTVVVIALDARTGREIARFPGLRVSELRDGRFVIHRPEGLDLLDASLAKKLSIAGDNAEISPDGNRLVFTKPWESYEDYYSVAPWLRNLADGSELDLRPLLEPGQLHPARAAWVRLAPVIADHCAGVGMAYSCRRAAVTIGGRSYGLNDDVACTPIPGREAGGGRGTTLACLDPRGPVGDVEGYGKSALVCRVGPHVLNIGVCAHLLARPTVTRESSEDE